MKSQVQDIAYYEQTLKLFYLNGYFIFYLQLTLKTMWKKIKAAPHTPQSQIQK